MIFQLFLNKFTQLDYCYLRKVFLVHKEALTNFFINQAGFIKRRIFIIQNFQNIIFYFIFTNLIT
jgi:hypothetical protein